MLAASGFLGILALLAGLGSAVVAIMVLIKLFQTEGAGKGILGLICMIYTYIWGWMNATRLNLKKLMLIWTVLLIVFIILYFIAIAGAVASLPTTPTATP